MANVQDVVVITGASSGVGRSVARRFARDGARVGLIARGRQGLEETKKEVEELGGEAFVAPADVSDFEQVERAADQIEEAFGPINIWINNAMVSVFGRAWEAEPEEIKRVTDVNYHGCVNGTLAAIKRMRAHGGGKVVQVGSALAFRGIPLQAPYCASKHAVKGFTESLRCELRHDGIPVELTEVHLPAVNTTQFNWVQSKLPNRAQPVPPIFQPEVPARAIHWAAYHKRRTVYCGFPTVKVIWGNRLFPWLADWMLSRQGISSQQTDEPEDNSRPNNLWHPIDGWHAAHGRFDDRAKSQSLQLWATMYRGPLLALALLTLVAAAVLLWFQLPHG